MLGAGGRAVSSNDHQLMLMEHAHRQQQLQHQQQQQQQQWVSSMEAVWVAEGAAAAAPRLADVSPAVGAARAWTVGSVGATTPQMVLPSFHPILLPAAVDAAAASASESIIRSIICQQPLVATHAGSCVHIPAPLQQLPPRAKSAFFRRATMLSRHAGECSTPSMVFVRICDDNRPCLRHYYQQQHHDRPQVPSLLSVCSSSATASPLGSEWMRVWRGSCPLIP
jgi:hypothetical protein